jgi:type VI secretion system Hcp family effector
MKRTYTILSLILLLGLISYTSVYSAEDIRIKVVGDKQGIFKGEMPITTDWTDVIGYKLQLSRPLSYSNTGTSIGKVSLEDITIVKALGKSDPQYFKALLMTERLDVTIQIYRVNPPNAPVLLEEITLTEAFVTNVNESKDYSNIGSNDPTPVQTISFIPKTIKIENKESKIVVGYDFVFQRFIP